MPMHTPMGRKGIISTLVMQILQNEEYALAGSRKSGAVTFITAVHIAMTQLVIEIANAQLDAVFKELSQEELD